MVGDDGQRSRFDQGVGAVDQDGPESEHVGLSGHGLPLIWWKGSKVESQPHAPLPANAGTNSAPMRSMTSTNADRGGWS